MLCDNMYLLTGITKVCFCIFSGFFLFNIILVVVMRHFSKTEAFLLPNIMTQLQIFLKICVTIYRTTLKHRNYPTTW